MLDVTDCRIILPGPKDRKQILCYVELTFNSVLRVRDIMLIHGTTRDFVMFPQRPARYLLCDRCHHRCPLVNHFCGMCGQRLPPVTHSETHYFDIVYLISQAFRAKLEELVISKYTLRLGKDGTKAV